MICVSSCLSTRSCTRRPHSSSGSVITWELAHETQSANHMMDAQRDDGEGAEPTLVMGASIVMEWIRAIEECLRCELPARFKTFKKWFDTLVVFQTRSNERSCVRSTLNANKQLEDFMSWQGTPRVSIMCLPAPSPSLPRDVVDLTSREPFLRSLCLLDWMSGEKKTPHSNTNTAQVQWRGSLWLPVQYFSHLFKAFK